MSNSKITLKDIYDIVNRLEDKTDKRICLLEEKINGLESFKDNLVGKITLMTGVLSLTFSLVWQWFKEKFKV